MFRFRLPAMFRTDVENFLRGTSSSRVEERGREILVDIGGPAVASFIATFAEYPTLEKLDLIETAGWTPEAAREFVRQCRLEFGAIDVRVREIRRKA